MSVAEPVLSKIPVSSTPTRKSSTTSNTSRSPSKLTAPSNSVITPATNFDGVMNANTKLTPGSSNNSGGADKQANNVINGHTPSTKASHTATRHNSTNRGSKQMRKDQPNIGKYKLIRTLGRGNFAKVKLAEHVTTGQQVAVKVIDKTELNSASLQKLSREVKIMKMLNHPNIVRLYEVIESERHVYLVIEYAPNGEVFDFLVTNGRMKEKEARVKFRQLVSAVEYCHSKKIVHRDLKAENLLLDKDYNIKLCDFGFSNFFDGSNKLDTFCGSPPYAAPELFQGQKYYGPEVDIWSLGVILYTLVSGSLPFDAQTLKDLQTRVIRGKYRVPFYMSSECELLLRKLLVLNPSKRKPLGTIMSDKWMNLGFDDALEPYSESLLDYNDPERISLMESLGFQASEVREALEKQLFNNVTAIYLLLADPRARKNLLAPNSSKRPKVRLIQSSDSAVNNTIEEDGVTNKPTSATITTTTSSSPHSSSDAARSPLVDDSPTKRIKTDIKVITTPSVEINGLSNAGVSTPIDRKVGVSWIKQSISAGPAPSGRIEKVKVEGSPPSHLSTETAQTVEGDDISPGDSAWLRRTNTFTTKPMRQMIGTDELSPEQLQQPLTRAAQYSDIPNHLSSGPRDGSQMEFSTSQRYDSRILLEEKEDETLRAPLVEQPHITPAIPYRKYENPTFSCHRPRTEPGGTATPTTAPIARIDPKLKSEAVDMLDPIARHQFARNCPERATVAVGQVHKRRLHSKAPPPALAQQINAPESTSSYSTASRVDTSGGSSNNTLNSDSAHRRRNNTPIALTTHPTEPDTDLTLTTLVTSLKCATDSPLHRDTKITISARYRSPGVDNSRPQPSVDIVPITPAVEYDTRSEKRPFFRRLTTQLSKRFRRSHRRRAAADTDVTPIVKHEPSTPTTNTQAADNPSVVQHHGELDASPNPWTARRPPRKQSMPAGESAHLTYLESDDALPSGGAHSNDLGRDDEPFFLDSQSRTLKHAHPNDAIHQRRTFIAEHHSPKPRRLTPFFHQLPIYGTEPLELLNNAMHVLDMNRITYRMENDYCLLCTNVSNQPAIFNSNPSNLSPGTANNDDPSAAHVPPALVSTVDEMAEEKTHLIDADSNKNNNNHSDIPSIQWRIEVFRIGKRYGIRFKRLNGNVHDFKQMEKFLAPQFKVK